MSFITPEGARKAQLDSSDRVPVANALLSGLENIVKYNTGVCHDVVAYTLYMRGASISPNELAESTGQAWLRKFNYLGGEKWDGYSVIPKGKAVGFYRLIDKTFFHSAITTGNMDYIRSVNGFKLGSGWNEAVDLSWVLGKMNEDGTFNYDGTKIEVYISSL
ncbi:hypothetical protein C1637_14295 [Chryseobacterium lactis]|uniref:Urea amidohydrolase n=1 Tax=Chryseobacterium lactis TaxID=1241981 RepID=A0A3G6RJP0_CHRLC|nr:hypothetical protein [Chryseobacterium lactis]AZA83708.1 hypothetical protein EG342_18270 [Chryseobacterium lactis]AZB04093.1 hypothetical protein EG341_09145 [Chryseobacterium lactis]PNW12999.1 hypothetical protein C1637_14295 [Chryseobacterium lactis]